MNVPQFELAGNITVGSGEDQAADNADDAIHDDVGFELCVENKVVQDCIQKKGHAQGESADSKVACWLIDRARLSTPTHKAHMGGFCVGKRTYGKKERQNNTPQGLPVECLCAAFQPIHNPTLTHSPPIHKKGKGQRRVSEHEHTNNRTLCSNHNVQIGTAAVSNPMPLNNPETAGDEVFSLSI